jgi:hypothetical protein
MISLKKYLEMEHEKAGATRRAEDPADLLAATLSSYRAVLLITGTSSVRACPPIGAELQKRLAELEKNIFRNCDLRAREYKIQTGGGAAEAKVPVTGLAQWKPGGSMQDVLEHADNSMYTEKGLKKKPTR